MKMRPINTIKTKDEARQLAIDWQAWASNKALYMSECAEWGEYFTILAHKYHLIREFKENGVI